MVEMIHQLATSYYIERSMDEIINISVKRDTHLIVNYEVRQVIVENGLIIREMVEVANGSNRW